MAVQLQSPAGLRNCFSKLGFGSVFPVLYFLVIEIGLPNKQQTSTRSRIICTLGFCISVHLHGFCEVLLFGFGNSNFQSFSLLCPCLSPHSLFCPSVSHQSVLCWSSLSLDPNGNFYALLSLFSGSESLPISSFT